MLPNVFGKLFAGLKGNKVGGRAKKAGAGLGMLMKVGMAAAVYPAVQLIGAYTAQAITLLQAIGPAAVAAGAVGAAAFVSMGLAVGSVVVALKTQSKMLDRFKEVTKGVKKSWEAVGLSIQKAMLPSLSAAAVKTEKLIPVMSEGMGKIGAEVGKVAEKFVDMLTSTDNMKRLDGILAGSAVTTKNFGSAFTSLGEAALIVLNAIQPLVNEFSAFVAGLTEGWTESLRMAEASGALVAWFERAWETTKQLGRIFSATFRGLGNIFKASAAEGQPLLDRIEALSLKFYAWTSSMSGENALVSWFGASAEVTAAFNETMGKVKDLFGKIFTGDTGPTIAFIEAIGSLVDTLAVALPGLSALTVILAEIFKTLSDTGVMNAFIAALSMILQIIAAILQIPFLGDLIAIGLVVAKVASIFIGWRGVLVKIIQIARTLGLEIGSKMVLI
jgi:protein involved in ribonucleotide reduction